MLTDVELIAGLGEELAQEYRQAKRYVSEVPTQALLHVRSFTHRLTALLAQRAAVTFDSPNLYDRIELLNQRRLIDVRVTRALHRLRSDGNRGAHPEKYHLDEAGLLQLAQKAVKELLLLVEQLYPQLTGQPLPAYREQAVDASDSRELCYQAVMQDVPEAQYLLGMSFKSRALMQRQQADALQLTAATTAAAATESEQLLHKAAYWFSLAAAAEPRALFEHGVALLHGYHGAVDVAAGQQSIQQAAELGVVDAMALLGYFYLVGNGTIPQDLSLAEHFLQAAAAAEHAEALANLGVLFYQRGEIPTAFQHINQAARSGYPHAQYHLSLMLARGEGCAVDAMASEQWLAEAAEQGQLDAMLARAQHMLNDERFVGQDLSQAENYLRQVIRYGHSVPAMVELAIALSDGSLGRIDVVEAAAWLNLAHSRGNQQEQQVIVPLWHSLAQQVDSVLAKTHDTEQRRALLRAQELLTLPQS